MIHVVKSNVSAGDRARAVSCLKTARILDIDCFMPLAGAAQHPRLRGKIPLRALMRMLRQTNRIRLMMMKGLDHRWNE